MFKKLKPLKDLLWAAGIGVALMCLLVGLVAANFTSYYGDRARPVMDLRSGRTEKEASEAAADDSGSTATGLKADGTLHPLAETSKAKKAYLKKLTILCDSSFVALRGSELNSAAVWSSETGILPMDSVSDWKILYPADSSLISPSNAALDAKPKILVIAVGSDASAGMKKKSFTKNYTALVNNLAKANPEAKIVCLSLCSVTESYEGSDGMTAETAAKINSWIQAVCIDTGAYYGDLSEALCKDGYLLDEYADSSGRALNSEGLKALLNYLQKHDVTNQ